MDCTERVPLRSFASLRERFSPIPCEFAFIDCDFLSFVWKKALKTNGSSSAFIPIPSSSTLMVHPVTAPLLIWSNLGVSEILILPC